MTTDTVVGTKDNPFAAKVQRSLNEIIYSNLREDGDFGPNSTKALQDWQLIHGYEPDGAYLGDTKRVLDLYIDKRFLKEEHYAIVAKELQVPVSYVKAVTKVESKGSGFLMSGRNVILFERHIFYSRLNKILDGDPDQAREFMTRYGKKNLADVKAHLLVTYPDIYNPKTGGYKGTVNGVEYEWERYQKAAEIHAHAANLSASYGMFQIMGFNYYIIAGYESSEDMTSAFEESEFNQLMAFAKFVKANPGMWKAMRNADWATFASLYNGPGYAVNKYDVKIAEAVKSFA